jgi:hypothetical protein
MKIRLVVAAALTLAVLFLASQVGADGVQTSVGTVFVPDGSVITSDQQLPGQLPYTYIVDFTFGDGSGTALTEGDSDGTINFTTPVANLSFTGFGDFWLTDNLGDWFIYSDICCEGYGDTSGTFAGPGITSVSWMAIGGGSGISSMAYTLDGPASVPEPSMFVLFGAGIAALLLAGALRFCKNWAMDEAEWERRQGFRE